MRVIENAIKSCQNDFLKKLEPTQIKQVSQCMYEKAVKANVYIIKEGEVGEHMYVLASKLNLYLGILDLKLTYA